MRSPLRERGLAVKGRRLAAGRGAGVAPDIEVIDDPAQLAKGVDPQLDRAIKEMNAALEKNPPTRPQKPAYTDRTL